MSKRSRLKKMTKEAHGLRRLRILKGLSVRKAADLLGVSHTLVNHLELGRANISESYIKKFLEALNYSQEDWRLFLGGEKISDRPVQNRMADECTDKIQKLSEEKLRLLLAVLEAL